MLPYDNRAKSPTPPHTLQVLHAILIRVVKGQCTATDRCSSRFLENLLYKAIIALFFSLLGLFHIVSEFSMVTGSHKIGCA